MTRKTRCAKPTAHDAAQDVLGRYAQGQNFPINPARIAAAMNLPAYLCDTPSGQAGAADQRFFVAQELGHYLADQYDICDPHWARMFALELVMPEDTVLIGWARGYGLMRLAGTCRVTFAMMGERLRGLGLR